MSEFSEKDDDQPRLSLDQYFADPNHRERLLRTAKRILEELGVPKHITSSESAVQSAAGSYVRMVREKDYPEETTSEEFRLIVTTIMRRKILNRRRYISRQKRDFTRTEPIAEDTFLVDSREMETEFHDLIQDIVGLIKDVVDDATSLAQIKSLFYLLLEGVPKSQIPDILGITAQKYRNSQKLLDKIVNNYRREHGD